MKILLIDVDSKTPNIAIMKLSTYYKKNGDDVDFLQLKLNGYPSNKRVIKIDAKNYNAVYVSNIFTINQKGSINQLNQLPEEIDSCDLDYSLYPQNKTGYGFITKGCIRKCSFCFVPKTEGKLHFYQEIDDITKYGFKKISFMDNNILSYPEHLKILQEIIDKKIKCDFNQGLDIRLINNKNMKLLNNIRYNGKLTFAFDNWSFKKIIDSKLVIIQKHVKTNWMLKFFVYYNPINMDIKKLFLRIEYLKNKKILPYFMRDKVCWDVELKYFFIDFAAWINQPSFFCNVDFFTFLKKRYKNKELKYILKKRNYTNVIINLITEFDF